MKLNIVIVSLLVTATSFCSELKDRALLKLTKAGYILKHNNTKTTIPSYDVHKELRKMTRPQLNAYQAKHHVILRKMVDGSMQVEPGHGLKGGGPIGATIGCWVGRFVCQAVGYGIVAPIMAIPALVGGPVAYGVALAGTAGLIAPIVETASLGAAVAGGIIGGVITGPA